MTFGKNSPSGSDGVESNLGNERDHIFIKKYEPSNEIEINLSSSSDGLSSPEQEPDLESAKRDQKETFDLRRVA